jgi:hypothetical protein
MSEQIEFELERDEKIEFQLSKQELSQAVLFTTDWTVETVISQLSRENIGLSPAFQRRDAWRIEKKSRFIESVLLGLPIPQIVLAEDKDHKGRYLVLDGKQRLLTLMQFWGVAPESKWNNFKLADLHFLGELEGKSRVEMEGSPKFEEYITVFSNYPVRSSIIRNWPNSKYLETVFVRLNEGSLKLSPQELRQAMSTGPFSSYLDEFVWNSRAIRGLLRNDEPDFRMRDTELMLRFLAFSMFPQLYAGDMKAFLDEVMAQLNETWDQVSGIVRRELEDIDASIQFGIDTLGTKLARKFDLRTGKYSNNLNRAIAEIEVYYFKNADVQAWVRNRPEDFLDLLKRLTEEHVEFRSSVESTTKSLAAVGERFGRLGLELTKIIGSSVRPLKLAGTRLVS